MSAKSPTRRWYDAGLRFECRPDCGACCTNHGRYGYVYLEGDDSAKIAEFLGLTRAAFTRRYSVLDDGDRVLRMDQPACPFLDGARCSIYPVRPAQCRTFPFWRENVRSRASWTALRTFCPGIDHGPVHAPDAIQHNLDERETE